MRAFALLAELARAMRLNGNTVRIGRQNDEGAPLRAE